MKEKDGFLTSVCLTQSDNDNELFDDKLENDISLRCKNEEEKLTEVKFLSLGPMRVSSKENFKNNEMSALISMNGYTIEDVDSVIINDQKTARLARSHPYRQEREQDTNSRQILPNECYKIKYESFEFPDVGNFLSFDEQIFDKQFFNEVEKNMNNSGLKLDKRQRNGNCLHSLAGHSTCPLENFQALLQFIFNRYPHLITAVDSDELTPCNIAARAKSWQKALWLFQAGPQVQQFQKLLYAKNINVEFLSVILKKIPNLSTVTFENTKKTALITVLDSFNESKFAVVLLLIKYGAKLNAIHKEKNLSAMQLLIKTGNLRLIENVLTLLKSEDVMKILNPSNGSQDQQDHKNPLLTAIESADTLKTEELETLLKMLIHFNAKKSSFIIERVRNSNIPSKIKRLF